MTASPARASPDGSVASPGMIKTLGWLNVAFGAILMLCVTCLDGYLLILPTGMRMVNEQQKAVQAKQQASRNAEIKALRVQEDRAETPAEKAGLRAQRIVLETAPLDGVPPPTFDISALGLDDPRMQAHYAIDAVTGLIVNLLLIIAGIGLIRVKSWGRRMSIGVAIVKLVRLAAVGASLIFILTPIRDAKILQAGPPGVKVPQNASPLSLKWASTLTTVIYLSLCATYPIVLLVLLTRPGARQAVARSPAVGDF